MQSVLAHFQNSSHGASLIGEIGAAGSPKKSGKAFFAGMQCEGRDGVMAGLGPAIPAFALRTPKAWIPRAGHDERGPQGFRNHTGSTLLNLNDNSDFAVNLLSRDPV
jgi:hypothetical protein